MAGRNVAAYADRRMRRAPDGSGSLLSGGVVPLVSRRSPGIIETNDLEYPRRLGRRASMGSGGAQRLVRSDRPPRRPMMHIMTGRPQARAHQEIAASLLVSITPPTDRRDAPVDYGPELLEEMIALARMGYSGAEIADHWSISQDTMALWVRSKPEFAETYARANASQ